METLFIADDEKNIREGLKCILEWETLGFALCGEAANGEETLSGILQKIQVLFYWMSVCPSSPALILSELRANRAIAADLSS